jgi:hypothetical protein
MKRSVLFVLGGVLVGVVVIRTFFLDPMELMGWSMFWAGLFEGRIMDPAVVLESTTFWKSIGGAMAGGAMGLAAAAPGTEQK